MVPAYNLCMDLFIDLALSGFVCRVTVIGKEKGEPSKIPAPFVDFTLPIIPLVK